MSLTITVDTKGLEQLIRQEPARVDRWLRGVATQIVSDVKLRFNSGPPGRRYKRRGKYHIASSPGYGPNSDTGALKASIRKTPAGHLKYHISASGIYAQYLEHGTAHMAARPYIGPVFTDWQKKIEADAKDNLNLE